MRDKFGFPTTTRREIAGLATLSRTIPATHWEAIDADGRTLFTADTIKEAHAIAKRRKVVVAGYDYVDTYDWSMRQIRNGAR